MLAWMRCCLERLSDRGGLLIRASLYEFVQLPIHTTARHFDLVETALIDERGIHRSNPSNKVDHQFQSVNVIDLWEFASTIMDDSRKSTHH